ncbi:TniQ family protein [Rugamonas sp.]|uniref:TniQ family protein n=1 Tax=Rugamonas sp. TaxID=1926287 RepID=UPI0025F47FE1|nr:TniQ family protein [Rugamonas sp.]
MIHNIPIPLKDELAAGILERFAQVNGITSVELAIKLLRNSATDKRHQPPIWLLANACGLEQNIFTSRHSMLPVMYPISNYHGRPHESKQKQTIARRGFGTALTKFRWCIECSKLDLGFRGFSHLRRWHQIDGVHWCIEHRIPLSQSVKTAVQPASFISKRAEGIVLNDEEEISNPALLRLERILLNWLQRDRPLHLQTWSQVIGERCRILGLRVGEIGKRHVASDWIAEQFPDSWLSKYFPEILTKSPQSYVRKIDGACVDKHVSYPGLACAAILAVLYPSSDDALEVLNEVDKRVSNESIARFPRDMAIQVFMGGESLKAACNSVGAQLSEVESHLRDICLKRRVVNI